MLSDWFTAWISGGVYFMLKKDQRLFLGMQWDVQILVKNIISVFVYYKGSVWFLSTKYTSIY